MEHNKQKLLHLYEVYLIFPGYGDLLIWHQQSVSTSGQLSQLRPMVWVDVIHYCAVTATMECCLPRLTFELSFICVCQYKLLSMKQINWCAAIRTVISHSSCYLTYCRGELLILNNSSWAQIQTAAAGSTCSKKFYNSYISTVCGIWSSEMPQSTAETANVLGFSIVK